jgi:hypothetical protein
VFAIIAGRFEGVDQFFAGRTAGNPFYTGQYSDLLALIPFVALVSFLYLVAREKMLASKGT